MPMGLTEGIPRGNVPSCDCGGDKSVPGVHHFPHYSGTPTKWGFG